MPESENQVAPGETEPDALDAWCEEHGRFECPEVWHDEDFIGCEL